MGVSSCVSHSPFAERGGELSPGREKGSSSCHVINLLLSKCTRLIRTSVPMLMSLSSFFRMRFCDSELVSISQEGVRMLTLARVIFSSNKRAC